MGSKPDVSNADIRIALRRRTILGAQIYVSEGDDILECQIRDISDTGARLELVKAAIVPDQFTLLINNDGRKLPAKVIWRGEASIGVAFLIDD